MRDTRPLLDQVPFPAIRRGKLDTLQVNVGYRCNQSCFHCHVNAGPTRPEEMTAAVADVVLDFVKRRRIATLDITSGAPELNAHFRRLVREARALGAPWHVTARMLGNVALDGVVGMVPFAGDAFDVLFRANVRNVRLLRRWMDKQPR